MSSAPDPSARPPRGRPCPCGSGKDFEACCAPVLSGRRLAATAEELMRARFTAHVVHDFKFLHESDRSHAGRPYVPEAAGPAIAWTKLVIHAHEPGANADTAYVDFSAHGVDGGAEQVLHEKSEFHRVNGAWIYARAVRLGPAPYKSTAPRTGRNDPCPCGSGKKYKHCCLPRL